MAGMTSVVENANRTAAALCIPFIRMLAGAESFLFTQEANKGKLTGNAALLCHEIMARFGGVGNRLSVFILGALYAIHLSCARHYVCRPPATPRLKKM